MPDHQQDAADISWSPVTQLRTWGFYLCTPDGVIIGPIDPPSWDDDGPFTVMLLPDGGVGIVRS